MPQFNPNEHMMQLKSREGSKDYLPVQWRIVWFREECPQGTIDTEEVEVDLDREMEEEVFVWNAERRRSEKVMKKAKGYARFKAAITDGKGGRATGTKSECSASFSDYIEKAETGAIGRALAALGYGTAFAPELNEHERLVDSPIEHDSPTDDLADLKQYVGTVYRFNASDFEARWTAYKVHVLNEQVQDTDLTPAQKAQLRGTAREGEKRREEKQKAKAQ